MIRSYAELVVMVMLVSLSQLLIKIGSGKLQIGDGIAALVKSFMNPYLLAGAVAILIAPMLYFSALSRLPLHTAFSFNGLSYILVIVLGRSVLKEPISPYHVIGGIFILAGFAIQNGGSGLP